MLVTSFFLLLRFRFWENLLFCPSFPVLSLLSSSSPNLPFSMSHPSHNSKPSSLSKLSPSPLTSGAYIGRKCKASRLQCKTFISISDAQYLQANLLPASLPSRAASSTRREDRFLSNKCSWADRHLSCHHLYIIRKTIVSILCMQFGHCDEMLIDMLGEVPFDQLVLLLVERNVDILDRSAERLRAVARATTSILRG